MTDEKELIIVTTPKILDEDSVTDLNKKIMKKNEIINFLKDFNAKKEKSYVDIAYYNSYTTSSEAGLKVRTDVYNDVASNPNNRTSWPHLESSESEVHLKKFRSYIDNAIVALYLEKIADIDEYLIKHGIKIKKWSN